MVHNGPQNHTLIQRYIFSAGKQISVTRVVYSKSTSEESSISKGPFALMVSNKANYEEVEDEMDSRYLICPFNVESFNLVVGTGRSIERFVAEAK
jgi:hypothetical protein